MSQYKRQNLNQNRRRHHNQGNQPASLLGPPPNYMNSSVGQDMSQNTMHMQMDEKQRVFTGVVTSLHDYFGVVDEEVFFQLSVVKGNVPKVGEKVLVKAVYKPNQSVPWNAVKIQALSSQPLLKSPTPSLLHMSTVGPKQGILGAKPQMLFQQPPHRIPSLLSQKPMSLFQAVPHPVQLGRPGRFPMQPKGRFNQDIGRWDDSQRVVDFDSKKRKQRLVGQQGTIKKPRHERPFYRVPIARHGVTSPYCDTIEILRRYRNIVIPRDFFDVQLCWLDSFPLSQPFNLKYPCRFQLSERDEVCLDAGELATGDQTPSDCNTAFSAKVLLISSPGIEEFYRTCLLFTEDPNSWIENLEHPSKQIQFLLGRKGDEAVPIGGAWSPSLDGPDPETNPLTLVRTAIRCTKDLTGIDLSRCTNWLRFAELRYLRPGPHPCVERVIVFLPDIWSCVPSLVEWEAFTQLPSTGLELQPALPSSPGGTPPLPPSPPPNEDGSEKMKSTPEQMGSSSPVEPAIIARSSRTFKCTTVSLYAMSEFRKQKEKLSFESSVLAELFQEMLQRDFGYKIYRGLLSLPEAPEPTETEGKKNAEHEKVVERSSEREIEDKTKSQETPIMEQEPGDKILQPATGDSVESAHKTHSKLSRNTETTEQKGNGKHSADELSLHVDEDMLLLEEDQDGFGSKLDDTELRSNPSVHSDMDISHHDLDKESASTAVLPLESLLGLLYFDQNFCGYIQRRDVEKILLTLGLHLTTEQVKLLVNKVVPRYVCHYRTLKYCREEGMDGTSPDHSAENNLFITGNLGLLNMAINTPMKTSPAEPQDDLVPYNGTVINIRNMIEKMEHTENGRLQLENKIHTLECKMVDSQVRVTSVELENKNLTSEMQALQKRLAEMEQQIKSTEKQKYAVQRQLQENNRRLNPLHMELQKIIEKTNNILNPKDQKQQKVKEKDVCEDKDVDVTEEDAKDPPQCNETA